MKTNRIAIYVLAIATVLVYGLYVEYFGLNEVATDVSQSTASEYQLRDSNANYAIYDDSFGHTYYRIKYDDGTTATEGYTDKDVTIYEIGENTLKLEVSDGNYISEVTYFDLSDKSMAKYNDYILYEQEDLIVYFNTNYITVETLFNNNYKKAYYVNVTMPESITEVLKINDHLLNIKVMLDEVERNLYIAI